MHQCARGGKYPDAGRYLVGQVAAAKLSKYQGGKPGSRAHAYSGWIIKKEYDSGQNRHSE